MFMRLIHYDETELKLKMGNTLEDFLERIKLKLKYMRKQIKY